MIKNIVLALFVGVVYIDYVTEKGKHYIRIEENGQIRSVDVTKATNQGDVEKATRLGSLCLKERICTYGGR
jgi:hypothetical protein